MCIELQRVRVREIDDGGDEESPRPDRARVRGLPQNIHQQQVSRSHGASTTSLEYLEK